MGTAVTGPGTPNLDGLDDLARLRGVDTRPTLARVLTDLYVQKPAHTLDEETHYAHPVLRHSPCLPGAELAAISKECGPAHAAAIAARSALVGTNARVTEGRAPAARSSASSLLPRSSQWRRLIGEVETPAPAQW